MGKKSDAFLLNDGDRLRMSSDTTLVFKAAREIDAQHFDVNQERDMRSFCRQYVVTDRLLGSGAFGKVYMAIEQTTRTQVACKIVDLRLIGPKKKSRASKDAPQYAKNYDVKAEIKKVHSWGDQKKREIPLETKLATYFREFQILSSISHPNIIGLDKVFITNSGLYSFQDLLPAGDLYSYLASRNNNLLEAEAAAIVWQVLMALQFLHERNIVHRDLSPDNIMLTSLTTGARVVLTNFGSARKVLPLRKVNTVVGSEQYMSKIASNLHSEGSENKKSGGCSVAIDMWSVGGIAALLLFGILPFNGCPDHHDARLMVKMGLAKLERSVHYARLGETPKSFIRGLLVPDENDRMTVKEAFNHAWFSNTMYNTDFKGLYQRTIKHTRSRISGVPLVEFIRGRSNNIQYMDFSSQFLGEPWFQPREGSKSRNVPVEPPFKPFPRKMYEQGGLWPKRRKTRGMSEEATEAIANDWSGLAKRSDQSGPTFQATLSLSGEFKKPSVPALLRSDTLSNRLLGNRSSSKSLSGVQRTLEGAPVSDSPRMRSSTPLLDLSTSLSEVRRALKEAPVLRSDMKRITPAATAARPQSRLASCGGGTDGSYTRHQGFDNEKSATQGSATMRSPILISSFEEIDTPNPRDPSSGFANIDRASQKSSSIHRRSITCSLSSTNTPISLQNKTPVALNIRSRSKLRSRSRSRSADSVVPSTTSRRPRGSLYDYDIDDHTSDNENDKQLWKDRSLARNEQSKTSFGRTRSEVWAHEEYLRMTNEDIE